MSSNNNSTITAIPHLFRTTPTAEVVRDILKALRFSGIEDRRLFTKSDIDCAKFEEWLPLLEPYYIPCKAQQFIHDFSSAKAITVLRHLLRTQGYKLHAYEKVYQGVKQTHYQIEPDRRIPQPEISMVSSIHITFD